MNRTQIAAKVREVVDFANSRWPKLCLPYPKVSYYSKGRTAGKAFYDTCAVSFNEVLARENPTTFHETVIHEVAHHVTRRIFPSAAQHHGPEFKMVDRILGGRGTRCHSYDTSSTRIVKTKTRYKYACSCTIHGVAPATHKKIQAGATFRCRKCGVAIHYTKRVETFK